MQRGMKQSGLDTSKIIQERKDYDFIESEDKQYRNLISAIRLELKTNPSKVVVNTGLSKNQVKKVKKNGKTDMNSAFSEVETFFKGINSNITNEQKTESTEKKVEVVEQKVEVVEQKTEVVEQKTEVVEQKTESTELDTMKQTLKKVHFAKKEWESADVNAFPVFCDDDEDFIENDGEDQTNSNLFLNSNNPNLLEEVDNSTANNLNLLKGDNIKKATNDLANIFESFANTNITPKKEISTREYDIPQPVEFNGFLWTDGSKLPPCLKTTCNVLYQLFYKDAKKELQINNVLLYPPSSDRNVVTVVQRASHGTASRIIASFGSSENLDFDLDVGNHQAAAKYFLAKNTAIMMAFGICSSVSFSFDNSSSFIFKMRPTDHGTRQNKYPERRWILVIDYMTSTDIIKSKIQQTIRSATNGNTERARELEEKMMSIVKDTDYVKQKAENKMQQKTDASLETSNNNNVSSEVNNNNNNNNNNIDLDSSITDLNTKNSNSNQDKNKTDESEKKLSRQERRSKEINEKKKLAKLSRTNNSNPLNSGINGISNMLSGNQKAAAKSSIKEPVVKVENNDWSIENELKAKK